MRNYRRVVTVSCTKGWFNGYRTQHLQALSLIPLLLMMRAKHLGFISLGTIPSCCKVNYIRNICFLYNSSTCVGFLEEVHVTNVHQLSMLRPYPLSQACHIQIPGYYWNRDGLRSWLTRFTSSSSFALSTVIPIQSQQLPKVFRSTRSSIRGPTRLDWPSCLPLGCNYARVSRENRL